MHNSAENTDISIEIDHKNWLLNNVLFSVGQIVFRLKAELVIWNFSHSHKQRDNLLNTLFSLLE